MFSLQPLLYHKLILLLIYLLLVVVLVVVALAHMKELEEVQEDMLQVLFL